MANATIYFRMRAKRVAEGKYEQDASAGWRFVPIPDGGGRRPEWFTVAEKEAAKRQGRGFQYRMPDGGWSMQFDSVAAASAAADNQPMVSASALRGLTVAESTNPDNTNRLSLRSAVDFYLARKQGKKSPATLEAYTYILNEFLSRLPRQVKFVDQVNGDVLEDFLQALQKAGAAPKTVHNKVLAVCFMLKFAGLKEPSKLIELPNIEDEPVEPYAEADLKALFSAATDEEMIRYRFFLDTACREAEVAHAQWSDIDWKKSEYVVRGKTWKAVNGLTKSFTTKNHKSRRVPLTRELLDMLKKRSDKAEGVWIFSNEDGQPEGHFLRKFKKLAFRAGLNCGRCTSTRMMGAYDNKKAAEVSCKTSPEACEKHYLHRLRKTRATFWHENGISLRTIQDRLSHESLETTMRYIGVQDSSKTTKEDNLPMY